MDLLKRNYVKFGLIQSAIVALCLIVMEITGQNQSFDQKSPLFVVGMIISPFIVWFLGIRNKKKQQKGKLTFKQGFIEGFKISLIFGILSPFIFVLYYLLVNPNILEYVKVSYQMPNASNEAIIVTDMLIQLISAVIFGSIYSAIISFFVKSR